MDIGVPFPFYFAGAFFQLLMFVQAETKIGLSKISPHRQQPDHQTDIFHHRY
jgi:hypothetical protein